MPYLDTSVLVPLFVPEPESEAVRAWFAAQGSRALAISDWTLTEFASAMGIKVRDKGLKASQATRACSLMDELAQQSFKIFTPTRVDFRRAANLLRQHRLGLRAGDALHLAIAQNQCVDCLYTMDQRLVKAARKLRFKAIAPNGKLA